MGCAELRVAVDERQFALWQVASPVVRNWSDRRPDLGVRREIFTSRGHSIPECLGTGGPITEFWRGAQQDSVDVLGRLARDGAAYKEAFEMDQGFDDYPHKKAVSKV